MKDEINLQAALAATRAERDAAQERVGKLEAELAAALAREPLQADSTEDRANRVEARVEQLQAEVSALAARLGSSDASSQLKVAMAPRLPGALHRLRRVHPGAVIYRPYGGKQGDLGFAVDLALDPKTHHTRAFTLANTFRVGTTGAGTGEGPVRPVEWWAAEGWDVLADLPVDARLLQDAERWILDGGES
jgi:multidrug efflux pump subunit AcrA (membrane-fusion protein)